MLFSQLGKQKKKYMPYNHQHKYFFLSECPDLPRSCGVEGVRRKQLTKRLQPFQAKGRESTLPPTRFLAAWAVCTAAEQDRLAGSCLPKGHWCADGPVPRSPPQFA